MYRVDDDFLEMIAKASEEETIELAGIYENPLSDDEVEQYLFICGALSYRTGLNMQQLNLDNPWMAQTKRKCPIVARSVKRYGRALAERYPS